MPTLLLRLRRASRAAGALLLVACGDAAGPATRPPVAALQLSPATSQLRVGEAVALIAVPRAADGAELRGRVVTFTSTDGTIATVSAAGLVHALAEGKVSISATSEGKGATVVVEVARATSPATRIALGVAPAALREGDTEQATATVLDAEGRPLEGHAIAWTSNDPGVAIVDEGGLVTGLREGQAVITAAHGTLSAAFQVTVSPVVAADLLVDAYPPGSVAPRTFLANVLTGQEVPLFGSAGTWGVKASPLGDRLAFTCTSDGPAICVSDRDGSNLRVLTDGDRAYEDEPAWSPDGQRIAFRRWAQGATPGAANPTDLWVMNADGTGQVNLTADALVQHAPVWSPVTIGGAYRLVYAEESDYEGTYRVSRLWSMRADGSDRRPVTAGGPWSESAPAWSPDASRLLFVRSGGPYDGELIVRNLFTKTEQPLLVAPLAGEQGSPAFSPDGRFIAFTSKHEASPNGNIRRQVYTVRADGTLLRRRTTTDVDKDGVSWLVRP